MKDLIEAKMKEMVAIAQAGLTRQEFLDAFKTVMASVKKMEEDCKAELDAKCKEAEDRLAELAQQHEDTIKRVESESQSTFSNVKKWAFEAVGKLFVKSKLDEKLGAVDLKLSELNDYQLPDHTLIAKQASELVKGELLPLIPTIPELTGENFREGLELLEGDERLEMKAIKGLLEELLAIRGLHKVYGGAVNMQTFIIHSIDNEVPAEVPNGVITAFTLTHTPSPATSLRVFLNGARQLVGASNDYTLSGLIVTFNSAPTTGSNIVFDYLI